ncbi:MAG: tRNA-dihydrouridine synthase [Planctomycetia bacterium]|nr:tRNA-dihydrouridine synthase [Planctomycetia bacterium]
MIKIGTLTLPTPFLQAPMAGFSNDAFRRILSRFGGVGLLAVEMIHARGALEIERRRKTLNGRLWGLPPKNNPTRRGNLEAQNSPKIPLAIQIWDNQPAPMAELTRKLLDQFDVQVIDINFGCPMPDVVQKAQSGAWLLQYPERMATLARAVVEAAEGVPVSAKFRLGFSADSLNAVENALALEESGVAALTLHGRSADQMYSGEANWEKIAEVKQRLKRIPLIGNGDIRTPQAAVRALQTYGVDGVMIGRAALQKPWIFRQADDLLHQRCDEDSLHLPTPQEQKELLLEHFAILLEQHSESEATILMRRFAPCYGAGLPNARKFRIAIQQATTAEEFRAAADNFFQDENL